MKQDNQKYIDLLLRGFVAAGGLLTIMWALYYIVTLIKDYWK